ncbi:hypothetical protein HanLR1_Chr01g0003801 [Helianthus annuus]|nr:hypothetical protein HanHA89_Chr01g0004401 [Helianthus annuus]KAJ0782060.1 hypothetical protein HanLR1_Chr01g0003801 [Helianthus annuus]
MFRRRFRMSRRLFLRIAGDMAQSDSFFTLRYDARGQRGFTNLQKCTSAICQLAYGYAPDALDEYLRMSERTARLCLHKFCEWVVKLYSKSTCGDRTQTTFKNIKHTNRDMVSQECSGALIACTGHGRTAQLPSKVSILGEIMSIDYYLEAVAS